MMIDTEISKTGALRLESAFEKASRHDVRLDLVRTFEDAQHACVDEKPGRGVFLRVAVAAVDLHVGVG